MIHLVIAESKKGYDWFEKSNVKINFIGSEFDRFDLDSFEVLNDKNESCLFFPENLYIRDEKHDMLLASWPRTEKELNSVLEKEFKTLLNLSKDKILYIFTTSEQVFHFFRIRVAKQEMKCEDLKVSFIEEFFYDLGDGEKYDFNEIKITILPDGYFDGWSNKMFGQTSHDLGELLRARRATNVPAPASEKSSTAP